MQAHGSVQLQERRCYSLGCKFYFSIPKNKAAIPCTGGCGFTFCSTECNEFHQQNGHSFACPHIKAIKNGSSKVGDLRVYAPHDIDTNIVEKEEDLPDISAMKLKEIKQELEQVYETDTRQFLEKSELVDTLTAARASCARKISINGSIPTNASEPPALKANREERIQQNSRLPSVLYKGAATTRRFRVGQRVEFGSAGGFAPGTIVALVYANDLNSVQAYEIEADDGLYTSARMDDDRIVRRIPGAPVVTNEPIHGTPPIHMHEDIQKEIQNGLPVCQRMAESLFGQPQLPHRDDYTCYNCAKPSKVKLSICDRCRTVVYCNAQCQRQHWKYHKQACKKIVAAQKEFVERCPGVRKHKKGRDHMREQSMQLGRSEVLRIFLEEDCGMPKGGLHMLADLVKSADDAARKSGSVQALVQTLVADQGDKYDTRLLTMESFLFLVAVTLRFQKSTPDLAGLSAIGVEMLLKVSHHQVLTRQPPVSQLERDMLAMAKSWSQEKQDMFSKVLKGEL